MVSARVDSSRRWWVLAIVVAAQFMFGVDAFIDEARGRAFGIYGIVLGLAGAAGFALGSGLVTLDLAGLGWRVVFFVNVPFGLGDRCRGVADHALGAAPAMFASLAPFALSIVAAVVFLSWMRRPAA
jgi:hypothetical protein